MNILWMIILFLLPLQGQSYVSVRTWQLLPALLPLRIVAVAL